MFYSTLHKITKNIRLNFGRIFFLILLLLPITPSKAQSYFFDNYGVSDGLAQSTVFSVYQDKKHIVWLGTRAGFEPKNRGVAEDILPSTDEKFNET